MELSLEVELPLKVEELPLDVEELPLEVELPLGSQKAARVQRPGLGLGLKHDVSTLMVNSFHGI